MLLWKKVILVSCFVLVSATCGYFFIHYLLKKRTCDVFVIQAIVQTGGQYAPLQTTYLAQKLDLSQDSPTSFNQFDLKEAKQKLLNTHLIKNVHLKKVKPAYLYIDYEVRKPIALLGDYTNTALDEEGKLFPLLPFFPPCCLPEVYLGKKAPLNPWGENIESKDIDLVKEILGIIPTIQRLDLSQKDALSAGRRQIVLLLQNGSILRLTPKNYAQELTNYFMLEKQMIANASVIDLRNPEVAYICYGK